MVPVFDGKEEEIHEAVFGEMNFHTSYEPARCVRTKRYKYIRYYDKEWQRETEDAIPDWQDYIDGYVVNERDAIYP